MTGFLEKRSLVNPPTIGQYLVGAFLGNAPLLFLGLALTFVDPVFLYSPETHLQVVVYSVVFTGGVLAGFMVSKMALSRCAVVGLIAGFFCFLVNFLMSLSLLKTLLFGWYSGYFGLVLFAGYGAAGGLLRQRQRGKLRIKPSST